MAGAATSGTAIVVVVDVANVMGSRPDGWWRDRAGAATALLAGMPGLVGRVVDGPEGLGGGPVRIERVVAVVEGAAKAAGAPDGIEVVRAPARASAERTMELGPGGRCRARRRGGSIDA